MRSWKLTELTISGHGRARHVPPVRRHVPRVAMSALMALLVFCIMPVLALADEGMGYDWGLLGTGYGYGEVVYGPVADKNENQRIVKTIGVVAANNYDAAAYALGYSREQVGSLDLVQRSKMSDPNYGGRFYEFAQLFGNPDPDVVFWYVYYALYGYENVWTATYDDDLYSGAKADFKTIYDGGEVGEGTESQEPEVTGSYTKFVLDASRIATNWPSNATVKVYENANLYSYSEYTKDAFLSRIGKSLTVELNTQTFNTLKSQSANYDILISAKTYWPNQNGGYGYGTTDLVFSRFTPDTYTMIEDSNGYNVTSTTYVYYDPSYSLGKFYLDASSGNIVLRDIGNDTNVNWTYLGRSNNTVGPFGWFRNGAYVMPNSPNPPDGDWPENEPDAPEPPELPTPTDPTIEPPDPYQPTTGNTYIWNTTNVTEPTDLTSITDWLSKIFQQLKAMQTDLNSWLQNLSNGQTSIRQALDNAASQIYGAVNGLQSAISLEFSSLKTYLKGLFEWLSDSMQFENAGYDDSSVIYWLKRIWAKGGNGVNTRPVDPTTDPDGAWDWLLRLIQNLTLNLAASLSDAVSDLGDLLSQVITQFPFSIPWDIALFLTALASPPVTPKFTLSIPEIEGWWEQVDFVIDLTPYDTMAATVRTMEKIIFAGFLAWKSKELLSFMDPTTWE